MANRPPRAPAERRESDRAAVRAALGEQARTCRELSRLSGIAERDLLVHLEHLERSLRGTGDRLVVEPASCVACGFRFAKRERLARPSRCPACKSERIDPPLFRIERRS